MALGCTSRHQYYLSNSADMAFRTGVSRHASRGSVPVGARRVRLALWQSRVEGVRMSSMLAVQAHERGGPENLHVERVDRPEPPPGEVLVEVRAAGITPTELTWDTTWTTKAGTSRLPTIPSHEVSGVVVAAGDPSATRVGGDEVYGLIEFFHNGAAAEYVSVPTEDLASKPKSVDHLHAAALPLSSLPTWQGLVHQAATR